MFSCKSRYACGKSQCSDSDEDSSYGFKTAGTGNRTRAVLTAAYDDDDHPDYHIYGNVTFGYKPILKTRLSSAASSIRRRPVKRTVSFSGVGPPSAASPDLVRRFSFRPPPQRIQPQPPCYSVAVRRASSFSTTRRNAAAEMMARRQRMPLPHENRVPLPWIAAVPRCSDNTSRVTVDVHKSTDNNCPESNCAKRTLPPPPPSSGVIPVSKRTLSAREEDKIYIIMR